MCSGTGDDAGFCAIIPGLSEVDLTQRIVYTTSNCSGFLSHSIDPDVLYSCESIALFDHLFYSQVAQQRTFWPLFQSKVLISCASDMNLFNPYDYGIVSQAAFLIICSVLNFML